MNSNEMKAKLLCWLRFQKGYKLVATEVTNNGSASDVLAYGDSKFLEIEIKTSASDMQRDFEKVYKPPRRSGKKAINKHAAIVAGEDSGVFTPNYFYFAVPDTLAETAKIILTERQALHYGIISVPSRKGVEPSVVHRTQDLRPGDSGRYMHVREAILARMSSQLASLLAETYLKK